jgi:hypothetical protein
MLQNIQRFYGKKLGAIDGHIGHVKDFHFDDRAWVIRYLVADTGHWLAGRQVLLPSHAFAANAFEAAESADNDILHVNLTREQIEQSPSIDLHSPISRGCEEAFHRYYRWPFYWTEGGRDDHLTTEALHEEKLPQSGEDPHPRSTLAMTGYHVQSTDGPVGSVTGLMIHGRDWRIRELIVEAAPEFAGEELFLLPESVDRISDEDATVFLNLAQNDIRQLAGGSKASILRRKRHQTTLS